MEHLEPGGARREPRQRLLDAEVEALAWRQLRVLTVRERRLLGLQAFGFSYAEIAALTGDSRRTVERQVLRGRRRLRA